MDNSIEKIDVTEAIENAGNAINSGFSELAGRIGTFESRSTLVDALGYVAEAIQSERRPSLTDAVELIALRISKGPDFEEPSLAQSVSEAGEDVRAGLDNLAAAIREMKTTGEIK